MKFTKLATYSILTLATLAAAPSFGDDPATRPTTAPSETARIAPLGTPGQLRRALRALSGKPVGVRPYTKQEWDDMMAFLDEYSPARAHVLANLPLPENSPIRLDAIRRWRTYTFTREHFPAIADLMLHRFKLEDDLFVLTLGAKADDSDTQETRDLIRNKVAQLTQLDLDEQQTRIDRLKTLLSDETQKLSHDQADQDRLIDQRTNQIMNRLRMPSPTASAPTTRPNGPTQFEEVSDPAAAPAITDPPQQ